MSNGYELKYIWVSHSSGKWQVQVTVNHQDNELKFQLSDDIGKRVIGLIRDSIESDLASLLQELLSQ